MPVDYSDESQPGVGVFLLQQGLQRRVVLTLTHDITPHFNWARVIDVAIGVCCGILA